MRKNTTGATSKLWQSIRDGGLFSTRLLWASGLRRFGINRRLGYWLRALGQVTA
jgi:hypothetical protein